MDVLYAGLGLILGCTAIVMWMKLGDGE